MPNKRLFQPLLAELFKPARQLSFCQALYYLGMDETDFAEVLGRYLFATNRELLDFEIAVDKVKFSLDKTLSFVIITNGKRTTLLPRPNAKSAHVRPTRLRNLY